MRADYCECGHWLGAHHSGCGCLDGLCPCMKFVAVSSPTPVLQPPNKRWARMRKHGPCMIFDWHETEEEARAAITAHFQTVAYFPDGDNGERKVGA